MRCEKHNCRDFAVSSMTVQNCVLGRSHALCSRTFDSLVTLKITKRIKNKYSVLPVHRATHAFFWSHFGDRDGVQGSEGCADEDENPGLSQTSDPTTS